MKSPILIENRIENAIQDHNVKCREGKCSDDIFNYGKCITHLNTKHYQHVFLNSVKHCSLVLTIWHNEKDWKELEYSITTNDGIFSDFIDSIVCQYIKERYEYYQETQ